MFSCGLVVVSEWCGAARASSGGQPGNSDREQFLTASTMGRATAPRRSLASTKPYWIQL